MKILVATATLLSASLAFSYSLTASGISSGAYMAQQFHTAFSEAVSGVGIVAGGPYYCAKNNPLLALHSCMSVSGGSPRAADSELASKYLESYGLIDPLENMQSAKVYALAGTKDKTVLPKVVDSVVQLYKAWGVKPQSLAYVNDLEVGHAFPTLDYGNECAAASEPP